MLGLLDKEKNMDTKKYKIIKKEKNTGIEYIQDPKIENDLIYEFNSEKDCLEKIDELKSDEKYLNYDIIMQIDDYNPVHEHETFYVINESELPQLPVFEVS